MQIYRSKREILPGDPRYPDAFGDARPNPEDYNDKGFQKRKVFRDWVFSYWSNNQCKFSMTELETNTDSGSKSQVLLLERQMDIVYYEMINNSK